MRTQYPGVVIGKVKEIDAANAAVKLEFPWLEESYLSDWAPVAMPMSGKKRGFYFMPEPDDQVLVAFNQGDFDSPCVVGFVWNGVATPPETDRNNRVVLTPGGHTLRFEDTKGSKKIILKSDGGHNLTIDDTAKTITVTDSGGSNQVVIDAAGTVTVKAASKVVVDAPQIELTSGATHPLVFGDSLKTFLNTMISTLQTHTHETQTCIGIPVVPSTSMALNSLQTYQDSTNSSKVKTG